MSRFPKHPDPITTRTIVESTAETFLVDEIWQYLLSWSDRTADFSTDKLPDGLRMVYYFVRFDGDVLNGGIAQVFQNHSPYEIRIILDCLEAIGAGESTELLRRATERYKWQPDEKARFRERAAYSDPILAEIDAVRCNDESSYRDYALLEAYCRQHPEKFVFDPVSKE